MVRMRATLNIDVELIRRASRLTGVSEPTALVTMGLEALVTRENARRLAELVGAEPMLSGIRRKRGGRAT
jgi:Arc/MetJ family transcription regulator